MTEYREFQVVTTTTYMLRIDALDFDPTEWLEQIEENAWRDSPDWDLRREVEPRDIRVEEIIEISTLIPGKHPSKRRMT